MNNIYKKILLTHDGSKLATAAIAHAVALAAAFEAELTVLQVVDVLVINSLTITPNGPVIANTKALEEMAKHEINTAKNHIYKIKKQLALAGVKKIKTAVKEGNASEEIIRYVKENGIDIVVMSTRGHSGLKRALLGSVADDVVRHCLCPVLLINPKKKERR